MIAQIQYNVDGMRLRIRQHKYKEVLSFPLRFSVSLAQSIIYSAFRSTIMSDTARRGAKAIAKAIQSKKNLPRQCIIKMKQLEAEIKRLEPKWSEEHQMLFVNWVAARCLNDGPFLEDTHAVFHGLRLSVKRNSRSTSVWHTYGCTLPDNTFWQYFRGTLHRHFTHFIEHDLSDDNVAQNAKDADIARTLVFREKGRWKEEDLFKEVRGDEREYIGRVAPKCNIVDLVI